MGYICYFKYPPPSSHCVHMLHREKSIHIGSSPSFNVNADRLEKKGLEVGDVVGGVVGSLEGEFDGDVVGDVVGVENVGEVDGLNIRNV